MPMQASASEEDLAVIVFDYLSRKGFTATAHQFSLETQGLFKRESRQPIASLQDLAEHFIEFRHICDTAKSLDHFLSQFNSAKLHSQRASDTAGREATRLTRIPAVQPQQAYPPPAHIFHHGQQGSNPGTVNGVHNTPATIIERPASFIVQGLNASHMTDPAKLAGNRNMLANGELDLDQFLNQIHEQ